MPTEALRATPGLYGERRAGVKASAVPARQATRRAVVRVCGRGGTLEAAARMPRNARRRMRVSGRSRAELAAGMRRATDRERAHGGGRAGSDQANTPARADNAAGDSDSAAVVESRRAPYSGRTRVSPPDPKASV